MIKIQITDGKDNVISEDQITVGKKDILIFKITDHNIPPNMLSKIAETVKMSMQKTFDSKSDEQKAILLPPYLTLKVLKILDE
jgi:excinuclease UvrABC ATPase subunit